MAGTSVQLRELSENFVNKKEFERQKREIAEQEEAARIESNDRQEKIKVRWNLDKGQFKGAKNPREVERELKKQKLKELLESVSGLSRCDDLAEILELVGLQDREIEYLTRFRRDWERIETHCPTELENLNTNSLFAEIKPHIDKLFAERKPKQTYERKRGYYRLGESGEIENGFGNLVHAEPFNWGLENYQRLLGMYTSPVLDDIFAGGGVSMLKLQRLFGLNRNRFPGGMPSFKQGRERLYDYRAVTKIMDALLSEKASGAGATKQGRPIRRWASDSAIRAHVFKGIESRMTAVAAPKHIAAAFMRIIGRHVPNSAKK